MWEQKVAGKKAARRPCPLPLAFAEGQEAALCRGHSSPSPRASWARVPLGPGAWKVTGLGPVRPCHCHIPRRLFGNQLTSSSSSVNKSFLIRWCQWLYRNPFLCGVCTPPQHGRGEAGRGAPQLRRHASFQLAKPVGSWRPKQVSHCSGSSSPCRYCPREGNRSPDSSQLHPARSLLKLLSQGLSH